MKRKQPKTEEIGIRELKSRASEVVRAVKEDRARYVITQRGKPAALIIPLDAVPIERIGRRGMGTVDETRGGNWQRLAER